ncbi:hypothetical protein EAG_05876 [Camponotus floridanus]|uniref:Uncharacterized protein n=1 Tax=Camponotus floridanus TaxID=104421 RepID=E2ACH0_CAMFO|nr:hypothetical protein EAG_05876 [Camponotus floridanus]
MSSSEEILKAIEDYLGEPAADTEVQFAPPTSLPKRPPRVKTLVQHSDRKNARKREIFLEQPPPPPARRSTRPYERPLPTLARTTSQPEVLKPMGPISVPPIQVKEPGLEFEVPHFAVHVSRCYKSRTS